MCIIEKFLGVHGGAAFNAHCARSSVLSAGISNAAGQESAKFAAGFGCGGCGVIDWAFERN